MTLVYVSGERGKLPEKMDFPRAKNVIAAGRSWQKFVGGFGLSGIYIPQHAEYGWGDWFIAHNGGVNCTFKRLPNGQ